MGVNVGTATGYLDIDISDFLAGLKSAQAEAKSVTDNMAVQAGSGLQSVGKTLTSVGSTLTKGVTLPVVGLGTSVVRVSADFESSMSKVQAISGATGGDFDKLNSKAREMGAKTKFSATEAADAFQYMAMAGWDVDSMLGGISGVMNLAAASGESLGTVSDIVTDAMTAFGLSAKGTSKVLKDGMEVEVDNTTRFVDALAAASNSSNTNVSLLGESFKYVAPVAGALGYSVEDTAVALGLMANQGIKAGNSGTALRTLLTNMANPTDVMTEAMDTLGVSLQNGDGSMKSLMDVMKDLRKGFGQGSMDADEFSSSMAELQGAFDSGKISEDEYASGVENLMKSMYGAEGAQKAQLAAQLAGKEGMAGLLAIVNTGEEDFDKLSNSIYNASGTSEEMADTMNDNLSGQLTIMKSSLEELALEFGEVLVPVIKDVIEWLKGLIQKFQDMSPEQKEQIVKWAAVAAAVGPVLLVFGKVVGGVGGILKAFGKVPGAIGGLKNGFGLLSGALGGLSTPFLGAVAIVGVLIGAFVHLWKTNEKFREKITEIWEGIKTKFEEFGQGIVDRLNALGFDFENFTEVLAAAWDAFCSLLAPIFEGVFSHISNIIGAALDIIMGILDIFIGLFTGNWEQVWEGVKGIFGAAWDFVVKTFENWWNVFKGIFDTILGWLGTSWEGLWNGVKNFFVGIWEGIKSFFTNTVNGIKNFLSNAWDSIKNTITTVFGAIGNFFKTIWNAISKTVSNVVTGISNFISGVFGAIRDIITNIMDGIKTVITNIWNAIKDTVSNIINGIKNVITNIFNGIKSTISNIINGIKTVVTNVFTGIKDTMTNIVKNAKQSVVNAMNNVKNGIVNIWTNIKNTFANIGKNIIQGIINGIGSMISGLYDSIKNALSGLVDKAKSFLGIKSPSTVMRDKIGKWMPPGIAEGFESAMDKATKDMQSSLDDSIESLETEDVNVGVQNDMMSVASSIAEYYESIEDRLAAAVARMKDSLEYLIAAGTAAASGVSAGYIGYNGMMKSDSGKDGGSNGDGSKTKDNSGNTYVFYTTKPIDEIEAARQMRRVERDIAEGFG